MNYPHIETVSRSIFQKAPLQIIKKTIGICNEVYELAYESDNYILRTNTQKGLLYGTHKFLPLFKQLEIKTPEIVAEDYSKSDFPFCYQILTKIEGKDLGLVMDHLRPSSLKQIAAEVSNILDKFLTLPPKQDFGGLRGMEEESISSQWASIQNRKKDILARNARTQVVDAEILQVFDEILHTYQDYLMKVEPRLYYDDINYKNVMIHEGKFAGLVDLDFLSKGDYLEAIGAMMSCWYGTQPGEMYVNEVMDQQQLSKLQREVVRMYAIVHLVVWTSQAGIQFNSNSSATINWDNVNRNKKKIIGIFRDLKV